MEYNHAVNKVIANYVDAFLKKTSGIIFDTVQDIGVGAERMMVRLSPFVVVYVEPRYAKLLSAHREMILEEDARMLIGVASLSAHPGLLYDMTKAITDYLLARIPTPVKNDLIQRYKELGVRTINFIAEKSIKQATKIAIIQLVSELIALKITHPSSIPVAPKNLTSGMLTTFQIYSLVDKASRSARKLRHDDKIIYDMLYSTKTEMLYFLIASRMDPLIVVTGNNDHANADALIDVLANILYEW